MLKFRVHSRRPHAERFEKGEKIMNNITQHIKARRSVRTYDGRTVDESIKEQLMSFANGIHNPFDIPVEFRFLDARENGLTCPVVSGTELFVGGKVKKMPNVSAAFGYSFEEFVLYAQSLGIGTVWVGGTMNRNAFEEAMELREDEVMPCVSPLGYTAKKKSVRESMMRKALKADERLPFEELFFDGSFDFPLPREKAGKFAEPLEMVRLAPSAVNKQPWRVVVTENAAHFYLKRSKGFSHVGAPDMQMIDVGIALCHFALTAKENGPDAHFVQENLGITSSSEVEYVASYVIK